MAHEFSHIESFGVSLKTGSSMVLFTDPLRPLPPENWFIVGGSGALSRCSQNHCIILLPVMRNARHRQVLSDVEAKS
jgi:hypothetical protein